MGVIRVNGDPICAIAMSPMRGWSMGKIDLGLLVFLTLVLELRGVLCAKYVPSF